MGGRAADDPKGLTLSVKGLMAWVAGLAALAGLVEETLRHANMHGAGGIVGVALVPYVVLISFSIRAFWKAPRVVVPTTMLIGGILWTLSLQALDRLPILGGVALLIAIPFATAIVLRAIFPEMARAEDEPDDRARPLTVRSLLSRSKGLGARPSPAKASSDPEL